MFSNTKIDNIKLKPTHYVILNALKEANGDIQLVELQTSLKINRGNFSNYINELHSYGLVGKYKIGKNVVIKLNNKQFNNSMTITQKLSLISNYMMKHPDIIDVVFEDPTILQNLLVQYSPNHSFSEPSIDDSFTPPPKDNQEKSTIILDSIESSILNLLDPVEYTKILQLEPHFSVTRKTLQRRINKLIDLQLIEPFAASSKNRNQKYRKIDPLLIKDQQSHDVLLGRDRT